MSFLLKKDIKRPFEGVFHWIKSDPFCLHRSCPLNWSCRSWEGATPMHRKWIKVVLRVYHLLNPGDSK